MRERKRLCVSLGNSRGSNVMYSTESVFCHLPAPSIPDFREILCHLTQSGTKFFLNVQTSSRFPQPFFLSFGLGHDYTYIYYETTENSKYSSVSHSDLSIMSKSLIEGVQTPDTCITVTLEKNLLVTNFNFQYISSAQVINC